MQPTIYKIVSKSEWEEAKTAGVFRGAAIDLSDGYIHFSTAEQVRETIRKHFTNQADLLLVEVAIEPLEEKLRWEPSRGGALFPHLYGELTLSQVRSVQDLTLGHDGQHIFPPNIPSE